MLGPFASCSKCPSCRSGYSFAEAQRFLDHLDEEMNRAYPVAAAVARRWLKNENIPFRVFKWTLFSAIPSIISVKLNPERSEFHWTSVVSDLTEKIERCSTEVTEGIKIQHPRREHNLDLNFPRALRAWPTFCG